MPRDSGPAGIAGSQVLAKYLWLAAASVTRAGLVEGGLVMGRGLTLPSLTQQVRGEQSRPLCCWVGAASPLN